MEGHDQFGLTPCLKWGERACNPVMGMNDLGTLIHDNATEHMHCPWIRKWRRLLVLIIAEKHRQMLHCASYAMYAYTPIDLELWEPFMPQRRNRNIMSPCSKLNAKIGDMTFFSTDSG